jgi:3-deoxy-manno-octulosonate cytidylyltransferase (CMP-KDO synthetase)
MSSIRVLENTHVIIPARYHSTRLPAKLLQDLGGMSVLERTYRQVCLAQPETITIATDHEAIAAAASTFGAAVQMTASTHLTGTDRIAEVVARSDFLPDSVIVNVQADEPFIPPELIRQVAQSLIENTSPMATLCTAIHRLEVLNNPHVVKVVRNQFNKALYFSRQAIPAHRDIADSVAGSYQHIGLYAYRAAFLLDYVQMPICELEQYECLEQLRVLWAGVEIQVDEAQVVGLQEINTLEDLQQARRML